MRFSIERVDLLKSMTVTNGVAERNPAIPVLANVLIEATDGKVSFRASDAKLEVIFWADAQIEQTGHTTVSAHLLHEIARKMPQGAMIELDTDANVGRLTVSAGRAIFKLATLPGDDFPLMQRHEFDCGFSLPVGSFRPLVGKTRFSMSQDDSRKYLNGVYLHIVPGDESESGMLRCVATDGHRLALASMDVPDGAETMPGIIVPQKTVGELLKVLEDTEEQLHVSVSEKIVQFELPSITMTSNVVEGTFPQYENVIPKNNENRLEIDRSAFIEAVDRVTTVSTERDTEAVTVAIETDLVKLNLNTVDKGTADEEVAAAYSGNPMKMGFNGSYLKDVSQHIDQSSVVFWLNSPEEPALVRDGDDTSSLFVVMPMRI
ncbi:MAG: DNA polymerase III subunit beta [Rhodobacteraceae bacterium]|nr:DNA polymerase III subunit beta [Paracoccaceae bacterium]MCY4138682.1 DNA polymerase III subunit beta [Paracoccaceae bacterium]